MEPNLTEHIRFLIVNIVIARTKLMEERYGYNSCQTDSHK